MRFPPLSRWSESPKQGSGGNENRGPLQVPGSFLLARHSPSFSLPPSHLLSLPSSLPYLLSRQPRAWGSWGELGRAGGQESSRSEDGSPAPP